ncbi:IQ and AAA domain-containing protein 1-like isoform X2 [Manduca sexta]|uniref:IQ and AAA domain-containing protein 1-like isoform X2 n=1 Tax=Manduca sexta TaxID=7130 RepID=UPI001183CB4B|nr:IQ and AAA domain-containing protein 1-like isoform X2 [Manduca sexta]
MSNDYYFKKWRNVIQRLETVVALDVEYQETKAHENTLCEEVHHLSGVLGQYMAVYSDAEDCYRHNLQLQKTSYMVEVIKAVVSRMLELKHDLQKFENSNLQFFGTGIIQARLTTYDIEMMNISAKIKRPKAVQTMIEEAMIKAKEIMESNLHEAKDEHAIEEVPVKTRNWWETDEIEEATEEPVEIEEQLSEETLRKREIIAMIQAHEKSRQVLTRVRHREVKRELWEKELNGTLRPPAPIELRERSAKLIQKVLRAYFELKRKKLEDCKRDELLGLRLCGGQDLLLKQDEENYRTELYNQYSEEWKISRNNMKQQFLKRRSEALKEDYRDYIRAWFQQWFNQVQYIHGIPKPNEGGIATILREEVLSPTEWVDEHKKYLEEKITNKNKTATQKKYEKLEAKREKMMQKKEELMKKKMEADFLKKLKKNPNLHPGYDYPPSKKTEHVIKAIEHYKKDWDAYDSTNAVEIKVKSVKELDIDHACMEAKLEILSVVDEEMRRELKILRRALKTDYENEGEKMPEDIKKSSKRRERKRKRKAIDKKIIAEKIEDLAIRGFVKEYPLIKFEDFMGDPNFVGEDLRCQYKQAFPHHGDIRRIWWDRCREMAHGFHKILLVGPKGSGKTRLVHVMASVNDAVLFVIDPENLPAEFLTAVYLQQLVNSIATCAKAVQPSVIYIKHVQRLFYAKVPAEEQDMDLDLLKRYFTKILFKKINKTDKVTIIGSCIDPWTTKSKNMFKQFQSVVLLPHTSYSVVLKLLQNWVISNSVIPKDLNINSLAYMLQGYNFGYLKDALNNFLTAERIVRIAAYGLYPQEIYDYIIQDDNQSVAEYEKYLKWYTEKTTWGIREKKHLEEQKEFQDLVKKFAEKDKKKKPKVISSVSTPNSVSSVNNSK